MSYIESNIINNESDMNIYTTVDALYNAIYHSSDFFLVIKNLPGNNTLYVDIDNTKLEELLRTGDNPICDISVGSGLCIESAKPFLSDIINNKEMVMRDPSALYVLNMQSEECNELQMKYGVVCQPASSPNMDFLINNHKCGSSIEAGTWGNYFSKLDTTPANSIIICDRYIFSDDDVAIQEGKLSFTSGNGCENILHILDRMLPPSLNVDFHIMIIFDKTIYHGRERYPSTRHKEMDDAHFRYLASHLNKAIKKLRKENYIITTELISVTQNDYLHEETHNRRIVSNYSELFVEHKLAAFKGSRGAVDQHIVYNTLFSEGLKDKSDLPIYSHTRRLNVFREIVNYGKHNEKAYDYVRNGNFSGSKISELKNRLIVH